MNLLDRYLEAAALKALVLVSAALTSLFSLLEFANQLHDVGKGQYRLIDALVYVLLTAPSTLLQLMPVSMLLASLFTLGRCAGNSELTAMLAAGVPERRIMGSIFKLAGSTMVLLFLLAEFVIPPAQQLAETERASRISSSSSAPLRSGNGLWVEDDHQYLSVRQFEHGNVPKNVAIYAFTAAGELQSFIHADNAEVRPDGTWLLSGVVRKQFNETAIRTDHLASLAWHSFLRPAQFHLLILPPQSMPPVELFQYVRYLQRQRQPARRYEQELWSKIDVPLAMAAMIMISIPLVFGPLRTQSTGQRIMVGAAIGIVFTLSQQLTSYLGLLFALNPAVMATAPSLMLMAVAF